MIKFLLPSLIILNIAFNPLKGCILTDSGSDSAKKSENGKIHIRPVPVIAFAPETRFLSGVGAINTFKLYKDSATHYSLISAFAAYTENKQDYIYIPYQLYSKNNTYYMEGEADYYNFSFYYWGIGTNRVPQQLYDVRYPKFFVNAYRRIYKKFYAGIDYYYENDVISNTVPGDQLSTGTITGSKGSDNSGMGVCAIFDTRDSVYFPRKGWYVKATSYINSPVFGATYTYNNITSDVSWYKEIYAPVVLALNEHTQITTGNVPFNQMALVGGRYDMRGYYFGYYRDNDMTMLQADARIHLFWRIGFDAFGGMCFMGNKNTFPESQSPIFAEGIGLRYNYDTRQHVNVRLDVGYGNTVEVYLEVLEAF